MMVIFSIRNTQSWKPKSISGKISVFKGYNDFMKWIQYRGTFSNMNIFSTMMSVEDMVQRTADPGTDCASPGDYLRKYLNNKV